MGCMYRRPRLGAQARRRGFTAHDNGDLVDERGCLSCVCCCFAELGELGLETWMGRDVDIGRQSRGGGG